VANGPMHMQHKPNYTRTLQCLNETSLHIVQADMLISPREQF
jgi:hypothetical protein